jgi:hypothetical protein
MSTQTILEVGAGKQYATINAAILAVNQMSGNADIKIAAGSYANDGGALADGINNVTIEGVGGMVTIVDPAYSASGKAAIVTGGQNILLKNLDISGVITASGTGAGIYYDQGTLTLDNVHLHDNESGFLSAADTSGSITIENSEIDHNRSSKVGTDNILIGDIAQFTLVDSYIHAANGGSEIKSAAENNTITNNRILDDDGAAAHSIDLPNGGNATITLNVMERDYLSVSKVVISYGEGGSLHTGRSVAFANNVVANDDADGGVLWSNHGATITGSGNTTWWLPDLGNVTALSAYTAVNVRPNLAVAPGTPDTTILTATQKITGPIDATMVTLSGTAINTQYAIKYVHIYDALNGTGTSDYGGTMIAGDGTWSFKTALLSNGKHNFYVTVEDASGNITAPVHTGATFSTLDTVAPQPVIKTIIGIPNVGYRLTGVSEANSIVTLTETVNKLTNYLGQVQASSTGAWTWTSGGRIDLSTVHSFRVEARDGANNQGVMPGAFFLTDTRADTLTATAGVSEVFAIMSFSGTDVIKGFQTASAVGATHDYINLSGRGISSFVQVQAALSGTSSAVLTLTAGKTVTLTNVASSSLTAADFRYS